MNKKILKNYVSEIDQFLKKFDKEHPKKSLSQQKEIQKYQRIYKLRDHSLVTEEKSQMWEKF